MCNMIGRCNAQSLAYHRVETQPAKSGKTAMYVAHNILKRVLNSHTTWIHLRQLSLNMHDALAPLMMPSTKGYHISEARNMQNGSMAPTAVAATSLLTRVQKSVASTVNFTA